MSRLRGLPKVLMADVPCVVPARLRPNCELPNGNHVVVDEQRGGLLRSYRRLV